MRVGDGPQCLVSCHRGEIDLPRLAGPSGVMFCPIAPTRDILSNSNGLLLYGPKACHGRKSISEEHRMNRLNKRPYHTFANGPKTQTVRELQEFGDEASRRLPNLGRDRSNARDGGGGVEIAHSDPGEWAGGVVGGWLGRRLTKRFGAGGQLGGALVGQYLGEKVGAGLGAMLGGPVPESVARRHDASGARLPGLLGLLGR